MKRLWGICFCIFIGCGGSTSTAKKALYVSSEALVQVDVQVATRYESAAQKALDDSNTAEEYRLSMMPWDHVEQSIRTSRAALFAAEAALDSARWGCTLHDLINAFKELKLSLSHILDGASYIDGAIDVLNAISTADCEER